MPENGQEGWKNYDYSPEINFGNSGGTAGVVAASSAITAAAAPVLVAGGSAFATGAFAASIPVVGWAVAAVAVVVGFAQMIHQGQKAKQYKDTAEALMAAGVVLEQELILLQGTGQAMIDENNKRIKEMHRTILHQQKLTAISMSLMSVTGLIAAYEIYKQTR